MLKTNMQTKIITLVVTISACLHTAVAIAYDAPHAQVAPIIDGLATDTAWDKAAWHRIDQLTLGETPSESDFSGRYKVVWTQEQLYILAEITDDVLIDTHADPLEMYWEDDTFEIFLDEDKSGGDHRQNYNAFAYHIALDNQSVDINSNGQARTLNQHIQSKWKRSANAPHTIIWEVSVNVYPSTFKDQYSQNEAPVKPVSLTTGKQMGFMLAYCDSDGINGREHFIGSVDVPAKNGDKNRAYIDASVFDSLTLVMEAAQTE